jgi:MFS family permease
VHVLQDRPRTGSCDHDPVTSVGPEVATAPAAPATPPPRLSELAAGTLTFLAAASVLVLEIAAGRLLAPFVGVSLTTYTGIIGVILAGIALGAWAGGRAADAYGPERLLGPTFVAGGWAAIAAVPIVSLLGAAGVATGVTEIVLLAAAGFVLPATILSAVAPMVVRATITDIASSGSLVGRLSAVATTGAIVGTFATGFVLLGLFPTRVIILATGALLVVVGLAVAWWLGASSTRVALAALASITLVIPAAAAPSPCEEESAYYCIAVIDDPGFPGTDRRILVLDDLWHAAVDLDDPTTLLFGYLRWFADATSAVVERRGDDLRALHVGGGGFTFPRYLGATEASSRHTVLELDPTILDVAQRELGFEPSEQIAVHLGDARLSIPHEPTDSYDIVAGDAFGGLSVPWHLTTDEFLGEVQRVLRPDGVYVMNLIDGPELGFVRAELATLRERFDHVAVVATRSALARSAGGNIVLVASDAPIDDVVIQQRIDARGEGAGAGVLSSSADPDGIDAFIGDAMILTDDHAPVDQLIGR